MRITVVGCGNLGGPLAELLEETHEHEVTRADKNPMLGNPDIGAASANADMVFVVVPTPSSEDGTYDISILHSALDEIEPGPIVVIVSTVLPGDCAALKAATGHTICYSPEFVRLGHVKADMRNPDFVLIGAPTHHIGAAVSGVLDSIHLVLKQTVLLKVIEAELAKIAINTYLCTKISFANMIGELAEALDANAEWVCEAVGFDHRIGHDYFKPGGAYRGPCLPRDAVALEALAKSLGLTAELAHAAETINKRTTTYLPDDGDRGY